MNPGIFRSCRVLRLPAGLLFLCFLAGCGGQAPPEPERPPPAPVKAVLPWTTTLDAWTRFPGVTQPLTGHFAHVTAPIEGRVLSVLTAASGKSTGEGRWVDTGEVLVHLDETIARTNLARAEAGQNELGPQVQQAANAVQVARKRIERIKKLQGSTIAGTQLPLVSNTEAEQARVALRDAEAQLAAIQAKQKSGVAAVKALREQLQLYTVRAPIAGWLSLIQVAPGQTLSAGTPIADIVDLRPIDVLGYVPPSHIGLISLGEPARIVTTDSRTPVASTAPEGKVVYVAVQGEPDTGSFAVKARFANEDQHLKANTLVFLSIRTDAPRPRLVLPESALLEAQEPPEVLVVTNLRKQDKRELGEVHHYRVLLGVRNRRRHRVEVQGLEPINPAGPVPPIGKALFVVAGGHGLNDGDEVQVTRVRPGAEHD